MILLLLFIMLCSGSPVSEDGYQLQVQPEVWAQEGLCVFIPCTCTYPKERWKWKPNGYWYRLSGKKENLVAASHWISKLSPGVQRRFKLRGNPDDGKCSLLITDVQKTDEGMYFFQIERYFSIQYNYTKWMVSLKVTNQMEPDIYILETLWPNRLGTVICVFNATFDGCPAPTFSWEGPVLSTSRSQVSTHQPSVLKIAPHSQDQGTNLTCSVRFTQRGKNFQKTVRLDVAYAPQSPIIRVSQVKGAAPQSRGNVAPSIHLQAQKGSFLQLLCEASSHPPAALSWSLGDQVLSYSNPMKPQDLALELSSLLPGDTGNYTCRAENALGKEMRMVHLEVQYAPEDLSVTVSIENGTVLQTLRRANTLRVLQGQSLQLRCAAHSSPPARLTWTRGPLSQSPLLPNEHGLLLLPQIRPDQEGEFTCQAQNLLGSQQVLVIIYVYYEKGTLTDAFSNGVLVGTGIAGFLSLCVILILLIFLRRKWKQTKQLSHRSTILDYTNIIPRSGSQDLNQEAEPHGPSQPSPPAPPPKPKKNSKQKQKPQEEHCAVSHAEVTPPPQASQYQEDEVQYSHLHFPGRRPRVLQTPNNRQDEYVELRCYLAQRMKTDRREITMKRRNPETKSPPNEYVGTRDRR